MWYWPFLPFSSLSFNLFWFSSFFPGGCQQCFNSFTCLWSLFACLHSIVKGQFSFKNHFVTLPPKILLHHSLAFIFQSHFFLTVMEETVVSCTLLGCLPVYTFSMLSASFVLLSPMLLPIPSHSYIFLHWTFSNELHVVARWLPETSSLQCNRFEESFLSVAPMQMLRVAPCKLILFLCPSLNQLEYWVAGIISQDNMLIVEGALWQGGSHAVIGLT